MAEIKTIQSIQFKRGQKTALEALTIIPLKGEPIFETDTNKLKIGDGVNTYINLPYIAGGSGGEDSRFVITDPQENQVLFFDSNSGKWVNRALTDDQTITLLSNVLALKGYDSAQDGQMPVKGSNGLKWETPVNTDQLNVAVKTASECATSAGTSAVNAWTDARAAEAAKKQIFELVNNKFWWGSLEEYNQLPSITGGTFYFVRTEV